MCTDPLKIGAVAVEEDLVEAEVNFADEGGTVQIVPLQGKTRRLRLKKRPVRRRRNWQQQRSD